MIDLRYKGRDVRVTPLDGRWRVECDEILVESPHLEYAVAHVLGIDDEDAMPVATDLLDEYLESQASDPGDEAGAVKPESGTQTENGGGDVARRMAVQQ
jgi:hypothetical protein